jgi:hypothetical protein
VQPEPLLLALVSLSQPQLVHKGRMGQNIIVRAFELAPECQTLAELMSKLKSEGFDEVELHLSGQSLKFQLKTRLQNPQHIKRRRR